VSVHFADDQSKEQAQRKAIFAISSARAEVNALVQGLVRREICDRHALQVALDGDGDGAKATVATAKTLVLARRAARGRFRLAAIAASDENQTFEPCFPEPAVSRSRVQGLGHATGLLIIFSEIYLLARA
jgi:hypothetical protein